MKIVKPVTPKGTAPNQRRGAMMLAAAACLTAGCWAATPALADTTLTLTKGWNLVNSQTPVTNVAASFGDAQKFISVWSWDAGSGQWQSFLANGLPPPPTRGDWRQPHHHPGWRGFLGQQQGVADRYHPW